MIEPTEVMLDLAVRHAKDALAEKTHFHLSSEEWDAFTALLDATVQPDPVLICLLKAPAPWDK